MATITPTVTRVMGDNDADGYKAVWTPMLVNDVGAGVALSGYADKSVQVTGTFGSGGTVVVEGNNDGTNFAGLTDPQGTAISMTTAGIKAITEAVINARPKVSAGDGTTSLTVTMFFRKTQT